jgi:hypothetical protein
MGSAGGVGVSGDMPARAGSNATGSGGGGGGAGYIVIYTPLLEDANAVYSPSHGP